MYKIESNDKYLQKAIKPLFEWYDEYLVYENLKKVLEKLRDTKPDTLTDNEGEELLNAYNTFQTLMETFGEINEVMDKED